MWWKFIGEEGELIVVVSHLSNETYSTKKEKLGNTYLSLCASIRLLLYFSISLYHVSCSALTFHARLRSRWHTILSVKDNEEDEDVELEAASPPAAEGAGSATSGHGRGPASVASPSRMFARPGLEAARQCHGRHLRRGRSSPHAAASTDAPLAGARVHRLDDNE